MQITIDLIPITAAENADDGGVAWGGADVTNVVVSNDLWTTAPLNAGDFTRNLVPVFATHPDFHKTHTVESVAMLIEGHSDAPGSGGGASGVGIRKLRLYDVSELAVGAEQNPGSGGPSLTLSGATPADGLISSLGDAGDAHAPLWGLTAAQMLAVLKGDNFAVALQLQSYASLGASPTPTAAIDQLRLRVVLVPDPTRYRIDEAAVERMVGQRLLERVDQSVVLLVFPDQPDPVRPDLPWARLASIDFLYRGSTRGALGETDEADLAITLAVECPMSVTRGRANAIGKALSHLRQALVEGSIDDRAATGHLVTLDDAQSPRDARVGMSAAARTAALVVAGYVERTSGGSELEDPPSS